MKNKVKYVDPTIGNVGDEQSVSMHGGGKTHPGACYPGGMVQLSADTVTGGDNGTGYNYIDSTIEGFSFNHLSGIGWYGDLGNIQVMPVVGETDLRSGTNEFSPLKKGKTGWCSEFSHKNETAEAGYYCVFLDRYKIKAEATVTEHTGLLKLTFPESNNAKLIFNLPRRIGGKADFQHLRVIDPTHLEGYIKCSPKGGGFGHGGGNISYTIHFYCEISKPFKAYSFFSDEEILSLKNEYSGEDVGFYCVFDTAENEDITLKVGISYVDIDGAKNNFTLEAKNTDFDTAKINAQLKWEQSLSVVDIETDNETDKILLYTCLYHTLLDPRTAVDSDGRYMASDGKIKTAADYKYRTVFSGWDVYRSEFPLLTIINPEVVNDEVNTLISISEAKNSAFPRWELMGIDSGCMVGDPGVIVVCDAFIKNIRNYDTLKAYEIARASCIGDNEKYKSIRPFPEFMNKHGYNPEKLSSTLEELLADFTVSRFAKSMGNKTDEELFYNRSMRVKDNFNPKTGFMNARFADGTFTPEDDEYDDGGCVESNIYQQSWFLPWNVPELVKLFGKERFISLLERFFERADFGALWNDDYNHSNEPCHNVTHLFNFVSLPHRTQYWVRRVQKEAYRTGAYGFCGNEDVGQLSAWYVLSAVGFAQVCPAVPEYQINSPLFKKAVIRLDKKYHNCEICNTFTVECDKNPLEYPYIKEIYLNGEKIDRTYLTFDEITNGGKLCFVMDNVGKGGM